MKNLLRATVLGTLLAPFAITLALASDPNEFTLDPVLPMPTTTITTTTSGTQ